MAEIYNFNPNSNVVPLRRQTTAPLPVDTAPDESDGDSGSGSGSHGIPLTSLIGYDTSIMTQYQTNTALVSYYKTLATDGKVEYPKEPVNNRDNEAGNGMGQGMGNGHGNGDSPFLPHPLLDGSPRFSSADNNAAQLPTIVSLDVLEQAIDPQFSDAPIAQLKMEIENELRNQMQKKPKLGNQLTSTPTLGR